MKARILGIDVGIAITGWSIIDEPSNSSACELVDYGAITTSAKQSMGVRLLDLHNQLIEIIDTYNPTEMAIEKLFYFRNKTTIITVGQARGVIVMTGEQKGLNLFHYTPLQVKTAVTGYGRAEKKQMQTMVTKIFKLKSVPKPDDVADAIAVGLCHVNSHSFNDLSKMKYNKA